MKKVLLKVGASVFALTLMTACGTSNEPVDDNPTIDHEERKDEFNDNQNDNDQMGRDDTNNFDEDQELPRNNK